MLSPRRYTNTERHVIQRSLSGSICDDDTRIWEDPPPPYSVDDPATSSSSYGSDGDVFLPTRQRQSPVYWPTTDHRHRSQKEVLSIMRENDKRWASGNQRSVQAFEFPDVAMAGITTRYPDNNTTRYIKLDEGLSDIEYLIVPKMPKPEAQCEYDGYRKKSIKNKFALPKKTVKKVETIVAYHYHLKSIVVNRIKETSRRPYRPGEKLSTPDKGKAPKLWKIECNEQNGERVTIPFTSEKAICPVCRCSKSEPCNQCHGFGRTPCYFCNGDGRISKIETHCITSHDGDSTPHTVHHSYACHHCHGQAMEMCAGCFGTGRCTCRTCKGSGYVVNYDEMIIKRYEMVNEYYTEVPGLDEKKLQKSEAKIIFHDKGKSLRPIQFKDCCQEEMVNASSAYLQYQAKKSTGKIRHQTHSVNLFEIYKVTFYDSKHIFWITGKNRKRSVSNNSQCKVM